ncbi:MAG: type VI secretion system contractile sheath domain-containing protein, partial [Planctomycetota bacterium]
MLTEHLDAILHHPGFRRVEAAWRGLASLVFSTETSELLKIRVLEIS